MQRIWRGIHRRWTHSINNHRIRHVAKQVTRNRPQAVAASGKYDKEVSTLNDPVIFFNASTRLSGLSLNAAYSLLASWGVQLSGVPVIHFVCQAGLSPCVLGTDPDHPDRQPPCRECIVQSRANYANAQVRWFEFQLDVDLGVMLANLALDDLIEFKYQGFPLGQLVLPSMRWILRCYHLTDDEKTRYLYCQYILSAWCVAKEFRKLLDEVNPQAVIVFNGILYPEAMVRWVAREVGVKVISHEVNMGAYSAFFTEEEATFRSMEMPEEFQLNKQQEERLDMYLKERFSGDFKMAGIRFWPEIRNLDDSFWRKASQFKQIVPVFTNVIFDTSQVHANSLFSDMFSWLDMLLTIMCDHPDTFFIIRAHPDETRTGKASRETVAQWVKRRKVNHLPNTLFVCPDEYISSYELIKRSKFVLTYNSTVGLEATLLGVAAVCAGKSHFTQIPTVFFPQTQEMFHSQIIDFLQKEEKIDVPQLFIDNARRFLYYQLFLSSLSFNEFIEEDGVWRGYVMLKQFPWQKLLAKNSPTIDAIVNGIVKGDAFIYPVN